MIRTDHAPGAYTKVQLPCPYSRRSSSQGAVSTSVQSAHFDLQQQDAGVRKTPMISIVDDDRAVRAATKGLVRSLGYDVSTFASAEEFLTSERLHDTSCLITDLHMPGLSGIELQDRLIAQGHHLPIVFITGFPEESLRTRALEAGAICFLTKPYSDDRLIDCLDRALKSADRSLNR